MNEQRGALQAASTGHPRGSMHTIHQWKQNLQEEIKKHQNSMDHTGTELNDTLHTHELFCGYNYCHSERAEVKYLVGGIIGAA